MAVSGAGMARIDYERASAVYDSGRAGPAESRAGWRPVLERLWRGRGSGPVLDLGAGTGIWSGDLAAWLDVDVIAVEPSEGMRARARRARRVVWVGGRAEELPLKEASVGGAWLSTVIHHVDLGRVVAELGHVVRPGGVVWLRSSFLIAATTLG